MKNKECSMITNQDNLIINEIINIKQLKPKTQKGLRRAVEIYTAANNSTLTELIAIAETEEENGTPPRKRQIKKHLINLQLYLKNQGYKNSSTHNYIGRVRSIYNYYEITLPHVPGVRVEYENNYNDLPTKEDIKKALNFTGIKVQALILFMATSGTGRAECSNLKIKDFIDATKEYHTGGSIMEILTQLKKQDIIPTWYIKRQKTGIKYYTFNTPEATKHIIYMLQERALLKPIKENDLLFELQPITITQHFRNINDRCGFGTKNGHRRFHAHALRKYFSTVLFGAGVDNLTIDYLLGHKVRGVQAAYIKANPAAQKEKYKKFINVLSFNNVEISADDAELEELREFKRDSLERIKRLEEMVRALSVNLE